MVCGRALGVIGGGAGLRALLTISTCVEEVFIDCGVDRREGRRPAGEPADLTEPSSEDSEGGCRDSKESLLVAGSAKSLDSSGAFGGDAIVACGLSTLHMDLGGRESENVGFE